MKTDCAAFVEAIAAAAVDATEISTEAAAHVRSCARCREKIAELRSVAALHREVAANLTEPKRRLGRTQLEDALANGGSRQRNSEIRWRPLLAGTLAVALIVGAAVLYRIPRGGVDARPQARQEQRATQAEEGAFLEPTLLALRHEVEGGREATLAGTSGTGIRHYRVRDAERTALSSEQ